MNSTFVLTPITRHTIDPATGKALYEVPIARKQDLDAAVTAARKAFPTWSATPFTSRVKLILTFATAIEENRTELEKLQTMEQGKPLGLAKQALATHIRHDGDPRGDAARRREENGVLDVPAAGRVRGDRAVELAVSAGLGENGTCTDHGE
jgi:acyl-CoA reductase-like NAD-dependent aldehyde dehydrogenase